MTERPKDLLDEAQRGRSERTPVIAMSVVTIAVGVLVVAILLAAFLVYYFA